MAVVGRWRWATGRVSAKRGERWLSNRACVVAGQRNGVAQAERIAKSACSASPEKPEKFWRMTAMMRLRSIQFATIW